MTEHEIDKLFDKLDRIEKRLDKLERAVSALASRDLKIGRTPTYVTGIPQAPIIMTMAIP